MYGILIGILLQANSAGEQVVNHEQQRWLREMMHQQMDRRKSAPVMSLSEQSAKQEAAYREYMFVNRFNKFLKSMRKFIDGYNAGTVDAKAVKEVRKAWQQVEKDGWFRQDTKSPVSAQNSVPQRCETEPPGDDQQEPR